MSAIRVVRAHYTKQRNESKEGKELIKPDYQHTEKITGLHLPSYITADEVFLFGFRALF
jgi:hypothetical protein